MTATAAVDRPGAIPAVADRPLIHHVAEWRVWPVFFGRALALQGMHPTIMKGIEDHSTLFEDPAARGERTMDYALRMFFGPDPEATAAEIRDLHSSIHGTAYDGSKYHARSRDVWAWVHLTAVESMLYALSVSFWPLPPGEAEAFYQHGRRIGRLYGVREDDMPSDVAALRRYVHQGVVDHLRPTPGSDRLRAMFEDRAFADLLPVPDPLRTPVARVLRQPLTTFVYGTFPAHVRSLWNVRWTPVHRVEYLTTLTALRAAVAPLPARLRRLPAAHAALCGSEAMSRG